MAEQISDVFLGTHRHRAHFCGDWQNPDMNSLNDILYRCLVLVTFAELGARAQQMCANGAMPIGRKFLSVQTTILPTGITVSVCLACVAMMCPAGTNAVCNTMLNICCKCSRDS